jgi:hypothetical protein
MTHTPYTAAAPTPAPQADLALLAELRESSETSEDCIFGCYVCLLIPVDVGDVNCLEFNDIARSKAIGRDLTKGQLRDVKRALERFELLTVRVSNDPPATAHIEVVKRHRETSDGVEVTGERARWPQVAVSLKPSKFSLSTPAPQPQEATGELLEGMNYNRPCIHPSQCDGSCMEAPQAQEQPVAWLRHGEAVPVQGVPFGAMWISDESDPRAFPVYASPKTLHRTPLNKLYDLPCLINPEPESPLTPLTVTDAMVDRACKAMAVEVARQDGITLTPAGYRQGKTARPEEHVHMVQYVRAALVAALAEDGET